MNGNEKEKSIIVKVRDTLIKAGTSFSDHKKRAFERAISRESSQQSKWVLETILENAIIAEENKSPLCDDTGIPHIVLEVGKSKAVEGKTLEAIKEGVAQGLDMLPGRPMAVKGNEVERIEQSVGLSEHSRDVEPAPILIKNTDDDVLKVHILMQGGGPAIRGKTHRIFHKHSLDVVLSEIIQWAKEAVAQVGCSPCVLAVGIGRSQLEATAMMTEAQIYGNFDNQSPLEARITNEVNEAKIGSLGLGGDTSVLATFLKIGPQRASGVRVVCLRPCCCFEPRLASVEL